MHILPAVGHHRLDHVSYAVIEDLKVRLSKTTIANATRRSRGDLRPQAIVRCLSPKSINNCLTVLHDMLTLARKRGLIAIVSDVEWMSPPDPEFDFLKFEEAERLVAAADGEWRTMIVVALRTGLRFGELLGLR